MRITDINMPAAAFDDGLSTVQMTRLGKVVVLAGKNGSGKTRLLNRIRRWGQAGGFGHANIARIEQEIHDLGRVIAGSVASPHVSTWQEQIRGLEVQREKRQWVTLSRGDPTVVTFVPKSLILTDCSDLPKGELLRAARAANSVSVEAFGECALACIQVVQNEQWEASHQDSPQTREQKQKAKENYDRLNKLIKTFLGESLSRTSAGEASLFGLPLGQVALSEGQKILLQFCVAIYTQAPNATDVIVVMDEPENHLHPSAMFEAIESIEKNLTDGQLWIATHSIPLLAHFDPSAIWWMESGKVSYAGNIPQTVLRGLLGDDEAISKTADFLNLPFELASNRFSYQCLFTPDVVMTGGDDPQTIQIMNVLRTFGSADRIRLLDFGAGKGRLASFIYDVPQSTELIEHLDFISFDPSPRFKTECENAIARLYGDARERYFQNLDELRSRYDDGSFDAVVMCNVLHEIEAGSWLRLFGAEGVVTKLLKDTGFLFLVEDNQLPVGEKPHQKGFLVLDTLQIKSLFSIKEVDRTFAVFPERNGRLKAHKIPKACVGRATTETRSEAIRRLAETAKQHIRQLREQEGTYQNGRLHGFWVQQFANAQLALEV